MFFRRVRRSLRDCSNPCLLRPSLSEKKNSFLVQGVPILSQDFTAFQRRHFDLPGPIANLSILALPLAEFSLAAQLPAQRSAPAIDQLQALLPDLPYLKAIHVRSLRSMGTCRLIGVVAPVGGSKGAPPPAAMMFLFSERLPAAVCLQMNPTLKRGTWEFAVLGREFLFRTVDLRRPGSLRGPLPS